MKKLVCLLALVAAAVLSACGSEGSDGTEEAIQADEQADAVPCTTCHSNFYCRDNVTHERITVIDSCSPQGSYNTCQKLVALGRCLGPCSMVGPNGCHPK